MRKYGKENRHIWRKLHLAVDVSTHEVIAAEVSLVLQRTMRFYLHCLTHYDERYSKSVLMEFMIQEHVTTY